MTPQEILQNFVDGYTNNPLKHEQVAWGRWLLKTPIKGVNNYLPPTAYLRGFDQLVDTSREVKPVVALLRAERTGLFLRKLTPLQEATFGQLKSSLGKDLWPVAIRNMAVMLSGFLIDADVRLSQGSLENKRLTARNYCVLWPPIACLNLTLFGKDPGPGRKALKLLNFWGRYDNVSDLYEDLGNGFTTIPKNQQTKFRINLVTGENLPESELKKYYAQEAKIVAKGLISSAKEIFDCGLDSRLATVAYIYFLSRSLKLQKPLKVVPETKYSPPEDTWI